MSAALGPSDPSVAAIIVVVAAAFEVTPHKIRSASRNRAHVIPRHAAMWIARETTRLSFPVIGRAVGRRDHSSVMHGVRRMEERMAADAVLAARVRGLLVVVQAGPVSL